MNPVKKLRGACRTVFHLAIAHYGAVVAKAFAKLHVLRREETDNRHLLLICSSFPPSAAGGTFRPTSFVRNAQSAGWTVTVVTQSSAVPRNDVEAELLKRISDLNVEIIRLPEVWLQPGHSFFPSMDGDLPATYAHFRWLRRRLKTIPYSVVMATGPHFDNFELARLISKASQVPLLVEYRDEWSDSPFQFVGLGKADRQFERNILKAADLAIFTTQSQVEKNRESFPDGPRRVIIPNGWDETLFGGIQPKEQSGGGKLTIRYLGNFGNHLDGQGFLFTLSEMLAARPDLRGTFEIRINGPIPGKAINLQGFASDLELADIVFWDGNLPQSDIPAMLADSDALLIVYPPPMQRYIPGKFYEYVASGTPILVCGSAGEVPRIVEDLNAGLVVSEANPSAMAAALDQLHRSSPQSFRSEKRVEWAQAHTRQAAAKRFFQTLDGLASPPAPEQAQS